ncbi:MAG: EamA-like transporter family protein [Mogibacterium sp.]|nr:EamA-like transporter family protein [Mogibacterium sp.]
MPNATERKTRIKHLIYLHLCILLFSMTEVVGKFAALEYKSLGLSSIKVYFLIFLMLCVCLLYAFFWQRIIKHFDLHIAYANRAMYLVWSQIWATAVFSENITPKNILGMLVVMLGVVLVSFGEHENGEGGTD